MATPPTFSSGAVLTAAQMNSVGLWLVKTQAVGTAVSSVAVTGAFSADYDNYFITYNGAATASGESLRLQLGATTTGYYGNLIYANYVSGAPASIGDNNGAVFRHIAGADGNSTSLILWVSNPFASQRTHVFAASYRDPSNAGQYNGYLANNTSYTGFTLVVPSGTITGGTIRVYGYRN